MKTNRWISLLATALLVATVIAVAQTGQQSAEPKRSLGVSLSLPDGSFVGFPIQNGTPEKYLNPIPISGYKNVFGIRMYPHMAGDKVALRLWVMVPKQELATESGTLDPTKVTHEHRLLGDYVVGKEGDSLQIGDVSKVRLPVLTAKVVRAAFPSDSPKAPCCCTTNGMFCCASSGDQLCKRCGNVCPSCGGFLSLKNETVLSPSADAKAENGDNTKH